MKKLLLYVCFVLLTSCSADLSQYTNVSENSSYKTKIRSFNCGFFYSSFKALNASFISLTPMSFISNFSVSFSREEPSHWKIPLR